MSWPIVNLGDIAEFIRGVTFKPHDLIEFGANDFVVCMRTKNIQKDLDESDLISLPKNLIKNKTKFLKKGDLLISTANSFELVGKSCWVPELEYPAVAGGFISILRAKEELLYPRYLFHWIKTSQTQNLLRNCGRQTTNISNMDFDRAKMLKIPVPPLNEQKRIAAILDKADAVRRKRQQAIELSEQLLRSVFLDMFGDPDSNLKGWNIEPLSKVINSLEGGKNIKPAESSLKAKNRILKVSAVTSGVYKHNESKPLPADYIPPNSYFVKKGDLLISRANTSELIGASAYVHDTPDNMVLPDKIWRIKWKNIDDIDPLFIHFLLGQPAIRREISSRASGTSGSMKNIPKPKLLEIKVPLPPPSEQKKFGEIANAIYKMNNRFQSSKVNYDNLFNSLAQQAFSGKLNKRLENELA
ncbi:TPA: restriction endonuclease subunit S [Legionella pneumophila]|nr:restriction endonuclease subunit S [Legionella pneumophila]